MNSTAIVSSTDKKTGIFLKACFAVLLGLILFGMPGQSIAASYQTVASRIDPDKPPRDSALTTKHWLMARTYQNQMRYELAREHYLLALANSRTSETVARLQRELQIIDMQIRTMR